MRSVSIAAVIALVTGAPLGVFADGPAPCNSETRPLAAVGDALVELGASIPGGCPVSGDDEEEIDFLAELVSRCGLAGQPPPAQQYSSSYGGMGSGYPTAYSYPGYGMGGFGGGFGPGLPPSPGSGAFSGGAASLGNGRDEAVREAIREAEMGAAQARRDVSYLRANPELHHRSGTDESHWSERLTRAQLLLLHSYTRDCYTPMNRALREAGTFAELAPRRRRLAAEALLAFVRLPRHRGAVIRGTQLPPEVLSRHAAGQELTYPAFTSTSIVASRSGPVMMTITSRTGRLVRSISRYPSENEVLFPPFTRFRITERTDNAGYHGQTVALEMQDLGLDLSAIFGFEREELDASLDQWASRARRAVDRCPVKGAVIDASNPEQVPWERSELLIAGRAYAFSACAIERIDQVVEEATGRLLEPLIESQCSPPLELAPVLASELSARFRQRVAQGLASEAVQR